LKGKILNVEKARFDKMLSSDEVGTLITALGCGIGKEEYNPDKLRYHRIIIMTDADVDGSHIRTLLLTFFYRQMPELVERGHIYIAQPPLYKIKKGKQEHYVKDDAGLNQYLIQLALDKAQLIIDESAPPIRGQGLEKLANEYISVSEITSRLASRYDETFLEYLTRIKPVDEDILQEQQKLTAWLSDLEHKLNEQTTKTVFSITLSYRSADDFTVTVEKRRFGNTKIFILHEGFFNSQDYRKTAQYANDTVELFDEEVSIKIGEKQHPVESFKQAFEWMMREVKKGQHIQRYKGLGEMNPEQLWETTLDAASRRMLQVKIEDAIAADEIFTTLMGDIVEPRRDFIVKNALDVANLDV